MKTALLLLALLAPLAHGADGYQHQTDYAGLERLNVKTGDVVKVRNFMVEKDADKGPELTIIMYSGRRYLVNEIKLNITASQWAHLKYSTMAFLRRGGERWELLGTEIYRDANGQTKFRY